MEAVEIGFYDVGDIYDNTTIYEIVKKELLTSKIHKKADTQENLACLLFLFSDYLDII